MTTSTLKPPSPTQRLLDAPVPARFRLSALWVAVMFLYVYVDLFSFYKPGTIDDILIGRVWEFDISQGWALGALGLMTVPCLMPFLSLAMRAGVTRWINLVVASLYVPISIFNIIGETWSFIWFGAAVETALLLMIVRYAWTWPKRAA
ncbi:MAG TPA: DUF6326 family protein [Acidimicrobiia bacterium]|nr:DUF6326 family protein [Acidimicrobiia bacterium]